MNKKTRKLFTWCLVVALVVTQMLFANVAFAATSYAGADRYQTALKVVQAGWTKNDSAVIARGDDLADALAAAPLAYAKGKAPILLTETATLPAGVMEELTALGVKNVYIVGGTGAVSQAVETALAAKFTVKRLFGADRAATALAVAKEAFPTAPTKAVMVNGYAVADALSISAIAAYNGMPILLVDKDTKAADVATYLTGKTVYAVGGEGVISAANLGTAKRLSGADRYATNVAVLGEFTLDYSKVFVAVGEDANAVDALGGAAFAALGNNPIVLVNGALTTAASDLLKGKMTADSKVFTLGGLVPASVATAIEGLVAAPTTLKVESVSATNPRQVVVTFNKAVDEDTITTDAVQIYRGTSTSEEAFTFNLSEDGKTLVLALTANSIAQDSKVKVVLEGIATVDGKEELANTVNTVTMRDTASPSVLSASFDNSKTITLKVSEPLQLEANAGSLHVMSNVLVDGQKLVGSLVQDLDGNTITVTLGAKLAVGEHKVKVTGYRDYANWLAPDAEFSASVVEDKAAPEIVSVKAGRTSVEVTFNEVVATLGNLTLNGATYTSGTTTDNKTFKIALTAGKELGLAYLVTGQISYYGTTDMEGNVKATSANPAKFTFVATDDTTAPTATVALDENNNIIITFSEEMSDPGKVKVQDADGVVLVKDLVPVVKDATKYEYKVTAANAKLNNVNAADTYKVTLTAAKDNSVRVNTIAETVANLTAADITASYVVGAILTQAATTKTNSAGTTVEDKKAQVTVFFSEKMDTATITNVNNYMFAVSGTAQVNLGAVEDVTLEAASDGKSVVITFPGTGTNGTTAGATTSSDIYVLLVKDVAGNTLATSPSTGYGFNAKVDVALASSNTLALDDADGALSTYGDAEVVMVAKNKIKVGFTNPMSVVDPSEFVVYKTTETTNVKLVGVAYELNAAGKIATITLSGNLTADAKTAALDTAAADLYIKAAGNTVDIFGNKIAAESGIKIDGSATDNATDGGAIADYVAPSFVSITAGAEGTAADNKFTVKFDEPVTVGTLANLKNDLMITDVDGNVLADTDYSIENIQTTPDDEVVFTVNAGVLADGEQSLTFKLIASRYLKDASANMVAPFEVTLSDLVADGVAPAAPVLANLTVTDKTTTAKDTLAGAAGAVEANAVVNVYSDSALTTLVGTATAGADGSFAAIDLADNHTGAVSYYVVAVDGVGNASAKTTVSDPGAN